MLRRRLVFRSRAAVLATVATVAAGLAAAPVAAQGPAGTPLQPPVAPPENPVTPAKSHLGKVLFWDEQLASTRTVACGTCHIPRGGASDPRTATSPLALHPGPDLTFDTPDDALGSPGVPQSLADGSYVDTASFGILPQATARRSRAASEAGYSASIFWDGRAGPALIDPVSGDVAITAGAALEAQVLGPPVSSVEMGHMLRDWSEVAGWIATAEPLALARAIPAELDQWLGLRSYPELFAEAFGSAGIDAVRIAMAIATYERELVSDRTPVDLAASGGPPLPPLQQAGRNVFVASGCGACHAGALFSDDAFHYIGVRPVNEDLGRFAISNAPIDRGAMRTPSLRNVALRAPYMHNGSLATLAEVVDFYDRGGDFNAPNKSPLVRPLGLTPQQKGALDAFLRQALTDPRAAAEAAPFDRPELFTESNRVPAIAGGGVPGGSGVVPQVVALEPPFAGNPAFTVGVWGVLGGASAVLAIDDLDPGPVPPESARLARETIVLSGSGDDDGWGSATIAIPAAPAIAGDAFVGRFYVDDPAAPGGFAVSAPFSFTVFATRRQARLWIFADDFESATLAAWSPVSP